MQIKFKHTFTHIVDLIESYVKGLNGYLSLSPRGAELLSQLLFHELNNTYGAREDINNYYLRVWLKDYFHIKDAALSSYYGALKDRGIIRRSKETGKWVLNPLFRVRFDDNDFGTIDLSYNLKLIESGESFKSTEV